MEKVNRYIELRFKDEESIGMKITNIPRNLKLGEILKISGVEQMFENKIATARFITQEQYDELYGDDEQ